MKLNWLFVIIGVLLFSACASANPTAAPPSTPVALNAIMTADPTDWPAPTLVTVLPTATSTLAPTSTPTRTPVPSPTILPTPDPYAGLTIADLASRKYGGGELKVEKTLGVTNTFTRTLVNWPSDGLTIYGFMDVPRGKGPFPVVIAIHGYIEPAIYNTLDYTTRYADALANAGYLVIHPNLRGYRPSDSGPDRFRVGMAVDVLNLIAVVRRQAGQPGPLQQANAQALGVWGHSMGGGIALRVITVSPDVKAAVLYGAMNGDEQKNYEQIRVWSGGAARPVELDTPAADLQRISPIFFLDRITAAVSIHHGASDPTVPPEWSRDLCDRLKNLNKNPECFSYPGQPHILTGASDALFIQRMIAFYDKQLKVK